ncbi:hypothetical protein DDZ14_15315 [Maritimibacter sp. 55A14]|uniref:hypothetical protein n=1 Tax=Maritimibacter sp. 55A14 TaxID=2174844 RepID=UPI000D61D5DD|nr:hypothetical protein [Maritimibacter sp. 55A14]PWE30524.1 hypothetical protein DDZ14_15315 [Maritimibacter sp. 55A14]
MYRKSLTYLRWFAFETRGIMAVEAALMMPVLAFFYMALYTWFDAQKNYGQSLKASYTVSDIIARHRQAMTPEFIDGLDTALNALDTTPGDPWLRVSLVTYNKQKAPNYFVLWSYASDGNDPLTQQQVVDMQPEEIPAMSDDDIVLLTETFITYEPIFNLGFDLGYWKTPEFGNQTWDIKFATRPRFVSQMACPTCPGVNNDGSFDPTVDMGDEH